MEEWGKSLESLKWNLWHGNVHRAQQLIEELEWALEPVSERSEKARKMEKAVREFGGYIKCSPMSRPQNGQFKVVSAASFKPCR